MDNANKSLGKADHDKESEYAIQSAKSLRICAGHGGGLVPDGIYVAISPVEKGDG
jgi:hypothetical protein